MTNTPVQNQAPHNNQGFKQQQKPSNQQEVTTNQVEKSESELKQMWYALSRNKAAVVGMVIIGFLLFLAVFGKLIMPYDPNYGDMAMNKQTPSMAHLFGTDEQGRDIFSRVIDGTRVSLSVGLAAVSFALVIGTFFGL